MPETIATFQRPQLQEFLAKNYNGHTTIVAVAGPVDHEEAVALLRPQLSRLPAGRTPRFTRATVQEEGPVAIQVCTEDTEQTHLAMGFHAFGRRDDRRFALRILSVILGENMSSRLFQKLRERHGYCYSVQTSVVTLDDTGCIHICAGLDPTKLRKALGMIMQELERICRRAPTRGELRKAQDYAAGQTFMGLESTTNQMMWMAESLLGYGAVLNPEETERKVLAVTAEEVQRVACHCLHRGRLGVAIVGPVTDAEEVRGWL